MNANFYTVMVSLKAAPRIGDQFMSNEDISPSLKFAIASSDGTRFLDGLKSRKIVRRH